MTTQAQKENKPAIANNDYILTKSGVMIVGDAALGNKLTALLCESILMNMKGNVSSVVVRTDNYPQVDGTPVFGMAYPDTNSISINLQRCWDSAVDLGKDPDVHESFLACLWINVLSVFGHELDHLALASINRDEYEALRMEEDGDKQLEEQAIDAGVRNILKLALKFDTEIPAVNEMGWFAAKIMELFMDDLDWIESAKAAVECNVIYDDGKMEITSFRDFIKQSYPDADSEDWEQNTAAVNINAHLMDDTIETLAAEPVMPAVADIQENDDEPDPGIVTQIDPAQADLFVQSAASEDDTPFVDDSKDEDGTIAKTTEFVEEKVAAAPVNQFVQVADVDDDGVVEMAPTAAWKEVADSSTPENSGLPIDPEGDELAADEAELQVPVNQEQQEEIDANQAAIDESPDGSTHKELPYTPHALDGETMKRAVQAVYKLMYHHIFTKCDWKMDPALGHYSFGEAGAVLTSINVSHVVAQLNAQNFIKEYDTVAADGKSKEAAIFDELTIRGFFTAGAGLPAYQIYLNIGGQRIRRTFVPQNPTTSSKTAALAKKGEQIAWVFKGEAPEGALFTEKTTVKVFNRGGNIEVETIG
jgi:hypothetical protein